MPTVPQYDNQRVASSPLPAVNAGSAPPEEAFGAGPSANVAANATANLANQAMQQAQYIHKEAYDQANQVRGFIMARQFNDFEAQAQAASMKIEGKDAAGFADQTLRDFDVESARIVGQAVNPDQQSMAQQLLEHNREKIQSWTTRFEAAKTQEYVAKESLNTQESWKDSFQRDINDFKQTDADLLMMQISAESYAKANGFGPDTTSQYIQKQVSDAASGGIGILVANDQTAQAKAVFERYKDRLDPKIVPQIEKLLKKSSDKGIAFDIANEEVFYPAPSTEEIPMTSETVTKRIEKRTEGMSADIKEMARQYGLHNLSIRNATIEQDKKDALKTVFDYMTDGTHTLADAQMKYSREWNILDPSEKSQLMAASVRENKETTDWKAWTAADLTPVEDLAKLTLGQLFLKYRHIMTGQQWESFVNRIAAYQKAPDKGMDFESDTNMLRNLLNRYEILPFNADMKKEDNATKYGYYKEKASQAIKSFEKSKYDGKKKATDEEAAGVLKRMIEEESQNNVTFSRWWWSNKVVPAANVVPSEAANAFVPIAEIPPSVLDSIKTKLGKKYTSDRAQRMFAAAKLEIGRAHV
jgi:hypothetical protein